MVEWVTGVKPLTLTEGEVKAVVPEEVCVVLFDLDGTLMNTIPLIIESFVHTLSGVLGRSVTAEEIRPHLGRTLVESLELFCPGQSAELCRVYREHNLARHDEVVRPYPGAVELVRELKLRGYGLGVVSSKTRQGVMKGLDLAELAPLFDVVVCEEDTSRHKPHPDPVLLAMRAWHVRPQEVVMIGDAPSDIQAAKASGAASAGASWGPFGRTELLKASPDILLEHPLELLAWCPPVSRTLHRRGEKTSG